ncbi:MAG: OmpA family protein [Planctomycetes bacterium]|nr:OmpA family protein [Planctomycetota bacterium]
MPDNAPQPGLTGFGKFFVFLVVVGCLAAAGWYMFGKPAAPTPTGTDASGAPPTPAPQADTPTEDAPPPEGLIPAATRAPAMPPAQAYQPQGGIVEIDISEYAGYAGLIVANNGLAPTPDSPLAKAVGFQVKLTKGEGELWDQLVSGRFAASATTVDVLAVLGRGYAVTVPLQLAWSRGADGIVVQSGIGSVNALKGRTVAVAPFNESEFLLRYLAQEAGIAVQPLDGLSTVPRPDAIGMVYGEDIDQVADAFAAETAAGRKRLAGFVGWAPKTEEVVQGSGGKARMLVTNRNLLVVADVLAVNRGFASANPAAVQGLVRGVLEGNRAVRAEPSRAYPLLKQAFGWDEAQAKAELARVHFCNLPENLAFFAGTIDSAGSYNGIYQSSVLAYGPQLVPDPVDGERFLDLAPLKALDAAGFAKGETVAIAPIRSGGKSAIEGSPLLSKDIRFLYEPNSADLDMKDAGNLKNLAAIKGYLTVSPGSMVLLRGHVDGSRIAEFRDKGGESLVRSMALKAMELSKNRAASVRKALVEGQGIPAERIETVGRGWEEPLPNADGDAQRRVEVQWFALE